MKQSAKSGARKAAKRLAKGAKPAKPLQGGAAKPRKTASMSQPSAKMQKQLAGALKKGNRSSYSSTSRKIGRPGTKSGPSKRAGAGKMTRMQTPKKLPKQLVKRFSKLAGKSKGMKRL